LQIGFLFPTKPDSAPAKEEARAKRHAIIILKGLLEL
jgi:hypothetical protein